MDSSTDYRAGLQGGCGLHESHLPPGSPHRRIGGEFKQPTYVSQHSPFLYRVVITTFNAREWEKYQEPAREKEGGERLEADATRTEGGVVKRVWCPKFAADGVTGEAFLQLSCPPLINPGLGEVFDCIDLELHVMKE